jgi:hypothetical protein
LTNEFVVFSGSPKTPAFKALLAVSKLLQTIANGIVKNTISTFEPHDIKIKAFVQEKIPFLKQFCRKMIDPKDIQYCQYDFFQILFFFPLSFFSINIIEKMIF